MSDEKPDWSLPKAAPLTEAERDRLVLAIDTLLRALETHETTAIESEIVHIANELRAARLLAASGNYRDETMSALLAKQMFFIGRSDASAELKSLAGDVIKAHLDVQS